jgi:hypothetical protein
MSIELPAITSARGQIHPKPAISAGMGRDYGEGDFENIRAGARVNGFRRGKTPGSAQNAQISGGATYYRQTASKLKGD